MAEVTEVPKVVKAKKRKAPKPRLPPCLSPTNCPIGLGLSNCKDPLVRKECVNFHTQQKLVAFSNLLPVGTAPVQSKTPKMDSCPPPPQVNSSGFTWTLKEALPLIGSLLVSALAVFQVYAALSTKVTALEKDLEYHREATKIELQHVKSSIQGLSEKLDNIAKSNEAIKLQLNELASTIIKSPGKR